MRKKIGESGSSNWKLRFRCARKKEMYEYLIRVAKQPEKTGSYGCTFGNAFDHRLQAAGYKTGNRKIRGVKSDHAVSKLVEYDLVEEVGRMDAPGKPLLFGTTEEFLRRFSVHSLDELPAPNPEQVAHFKEEAEDEVQLKLNL